MGRVVTIFLITILGSLYLFYYLQQITYKYMCIFKTIFFNFLSIIILLILPIYNDLNRRLSAAIPPHAPHHPEDGLLSVPTGRHASHDAASGVLLQTRKNNQHRATEITTLTAHAQPLTDDTS